MPRVWVYYVLFSVKVKKIDVERSAPTSCRFIELEIDPHHVCLTPQLLPITQRDPFLEASKRTDQFQRAWDRFSYISYLHLVAEDEETDEDLSSEWDNDSYQYQYSDSGTEADLDDIINEEEEINLHWHY